MPFEPINGILAYYQLCGDRTKSLDTIVMIHGWALDSTVWGDLIGLLETHFFVMMYDLRAHGKSGTGEETITWELLCNDLYQLTERLGLKRVHLLAFGYGTHLATKYTLQYPDRVQSLILLSLPYMSPNHVHFHLSQHVFPAMKETMESGNKHFLRQYKELLKGYTTLEADHPLLLHYFRVALNSPMHHFAHLLQLTLNSTLLTELSQIQCPVMIMTGELNATSPSGLFNASSFLLKYPTLITIPNASFLLFLEQPQETAKWIHTFISQKCPMLRNDSLSTKSEVSQLIQTIFQPTEHIPVQHTPILDIQLLHKFHVKIDSIPIASGWKQRHAKRLLTYLAFHPVTTREVICEELFPHLDANKALANLKVYLNHLDKLLRHPTVPVRGLLFHQGTVSVQYKIKCDLIDLMEVIRQAYHEQDTSIRYQMCEQLLDAFSNDILPDIHDDWAIRVKNQIETEVCELNEWMAKYCASQALYSKAAHFYMNMLHYRSDEEHIYDRIIEMFSQSDDHQAKKKWQRKKTIVLRKLAQSGI
ncbi:alpha/beta fold hydrolase [Effusibacillus consociatus]|uniref:Alpha/beta fold hydrolase n=1 Tax=Effusibacillus consociatus TaxID=1117041 RepID=A0ABV9Q6C3_9BACL